MRLMNSDTITLTVEKINVIMINNTDSVYTIGSYYKIERFENKEWAEIPTKYGSFENIEYVIKPNDGKRFFKINLNSRPLKSPFL